MAAAAEWVLRDADAESQRETPLSDDFWKRIAKLFPDAEPNGDPVHRLANTLNISFIGVDSETMLMALDLEGVCVERFGLHGWLG